MDLRDALDQIAEMRLRIAETHHFRGYRSVPVALSGLFAVIGTLTQMISLPEAATQPGLYVLLWSIVAAISILVTLSSRSLYHRRYGQSDTSQLTRLALQQLAFPVLCGFVVTLTLVRHAPEACWLLPGLWQIFFAQGVFASARILPKEIYGVSLWYLVCAIVQFTLIPRVYSLHPLLMGVPFGIGQLVTAILLFWKLERNHAETTNS